MRDRAPLSDLSKGAILGLSNTVVIAIVFAIAVGTGTTAVQDSSPIGNELCRSAQGEPGARQVLWAVLVYGWLNGIGWGLMFGSMTKSVANLSSVFRLGAYVMVAMLAMLLCVAFWPDIAPFAWTPTAIHAALLARWTWKPEGDQLPAAVAETACGYAQRWSKVNEEPPEGQPWGGQRWREASTIGSLSESRSRRERKR